uniref:Uncharacterized protein n=1 Tax=Sphaerodactylus townsendi TaxID=933632 RepID=A0ACB8FKL8_9SAUR
MSWSVVLPCYYITILNVRTAHAYIVILIPPTPKPIPPLPRLDGTLLELTLSEKPCRHFGERSWERQKSPFFAVQPAEGTTPVDCTLRADLCPVCSTPEPGGLARDKLPAQTFDPFLVVCPKQETRRPTTFPEDSGHISPSFVSSL